MALHETTCAQCGQTDDHPKVLGIGADDVWHHDCLPYHLEQQVRQHPDGAAAVDAAKSGKHGADLRDHIAGLNNAMEG